MADDNRRITWGAPAPSRHGSGTFLTVDVEGDELALLPDEEPTVDLDPAPKGPEVPEQVDDRYERRAILGQGGMGEVWRYWDRRLRRPVALKIIRKELLDPRILTRFEEEAQVSAQLQHPGIIPVHDFGVLDDGRMWFTMKEVRGRTLEEVLTQVHRAWRLGDDEAGGFSFRRMLEAFLRVCETVAYAHARGVVHRDIKPSNIMVGDYGEILVLDWGLAKALTADTVDDLESLGGEGLVDIGTGSELSRTRLGSIVGTPAYMAPEQARGESSTAGPAADVYALGATLYDLLAERPPRIGGSPRELVRRVAQGDPVLPPSAVADVPWCDEELDRICLKALQGAIADRYPDAGPLASDLAEWLDGARKRERAMLLVEQADERMIDANELTRTARALDHDAKAAMAGVADNAPASEKARAWALEDAATQARSQANDQRTTAVQLLRSALSHAPDLPEAHAKLAKHYRWAHKRLEVEGEVLPARAALAELREHDRSGRYAKYISGDGAITLVTDPPGALVKLHRFVEQGRRLVPVFERELGTTPLLMTKVGMGNYLLTLHAEGHDDVRYPVWIRREEHWDGIPPGESEPFPIRLPKDGELGPEDCYVPAGWFWYGDDELEAMPDLERRWCAPFVMKKFPVTTGEYVVFLNDLFETGRIDEAVAVQPICDDGAPWLDRDETGRWIGVRGDIDDPRMDILRGTPRIPIVYLGLPDAQAFAAWRTVQTGQPWRLPHAAEWHRAGRGSDQRIYPWGDQFEASWARSMSSGDSAHVVAVDEHPEDETVFQTRSMAGNVSEWALPIDQSHGIRFGGGCSGGPVTNRLTKLVSIARTADCRLGVLGFRLARKFL